jgi:predicted GH43/DUF377 family glycosyl hydrolase
MLVILPVHEKDAHLAVRNLEHCLHIDGHVDFPAWVCHERDYVPTAVIELARRYFINVEVFAYDPWKGDANWPYGANWAFQSIAREIERRGTKLPFFWWESDAVPVRPGWLSTLADAYTNGNQPFAGPVAFQPNLGHYMAGVAIYPPNLSHHYTTALLTRAMPWDVVASTRDGNLRKTHDLSNLICHTPVTNNTHFTSTDDIEREIPASAVLFHKCKDASLLDVLQGKIDPSAPNVSTAPKTSSTTVPSFTEQTPWPSGYFTFPHAPYTYHYNPSIASANGALHLFTRRHRFNLEAVTGGTLKGNRSDLSIWRIRDNMTLHPTPILPTMPARYPNEMWEDPRAMVGQDGVTYLSFATWIHHKQWAVRQSFAKLSNDWRTLTPLWETPYGGNNRRPDQGQRNEKNWIWFQHDNQWHCQYSINPGDVFKVDALGNATESWQTKEVAHSWEHGLPLRGGTPPTRIGNEYVAFFHTSTVWQKPKRRYYMGAYTFEAKPPFAIKRMTMKPLLSGSDQDFRALGGPLVIFPCGAHYNAGEWLVVFGVNDEACGWIKIPHVDLNNLLEPVKRGVVEKLALAFA